MDTKLFANELLETPVWTDAELPPVLATNHMAFLSFLNEHQDWAFWLSWYSQMWDGTFRDWDLATKVALIPNEVWEGEDAVAKVAEAIREIEARLLIDRLPQVEEVFEEAGGWYNVRTTGFDSNRLIDSIENRVRFTLDLAVRSNACDLNEMSTAAKVLRHALDNCLDDPNAVEQFLRRASDMIRARMADGSFANDDELDMLVATLDELALQLRADHPDVAQAVDARASQRFKELDTAQRLAGAQLIEDLREGTTGRLDAELGLATETLRDGSNDTANADALKQSGNRAGKISLAERAKAAESSGPMAGLKIGLRAHKVVDFVLGLISSGPM
ncbi:hypothetical protein [uncultured Tateyamaria sp.]|uniref:hypothetical protein n=1 Tax=uncultured Tateyamaria sp. TaxID=455651 RepID=UPI002639C4B7|nr:hypothetical protein [uncultured Tateyamaria sp.]